MGIITLFYSNRTRPRISHQSNLLPRRETLPGNQLQFLHPRLFERSKRPFQKHNVPNDPPRQTFHELQSNNQHGSPHRLGHPNERHPLRKFLSRLQTAMASSRASFEQRRNCQKQSFDHSRIDPESDVWDAGANVIDRGWRAALVWVYDAEYFERFDAGCKTERGRI